MVGDPCKAAVSRPVAANLRVARHTDGMTGQNPTYRTNSRSDGGQLIPAQEATHWV